jgi:hypothetical protein
MMVYKYLTAARFFECIDEYLAGKLYFANWKDMNDPMEGFFMVHKSTNEDISMHDKLLNELKKEKQRYKICSVSREPDNYLLWSHYADSHKGICIGIEANKPDLQPYVVEYKDHKPYINVINCLFVDDKIEEILTIKMNYWEYEKEIRFLKEMEEPKMIEIGVTKKIILGGSSPLKNFFEKYVNIKDVELSEAKIDHKTGAITLKPLNNTGENTDHERRPVSKKSMLI